MATIRYFTDLDGRSDELVHVFGMPNGEFETLFPGIPSARYDSYSRMVGYRKGERKAYPVTRRIEFKSNPSLHKCDSRCMNARGRNCECSCGGRNHGQGGFRAESVAELPLFPSA